MIAKPISLKTSVNINIYIFLAFQSRIKIEYLLNKLITMNKVEPSLEYKNDHQLVSYNDFIGSSSSDLKEFPTLLKSIDSNSLKLVVNDDSVSMDDLGLSPDSYCCFSLLNNNDYTYVQDYSTNKLWKDKKISNNPDFIDLPEMGIAFPLNVNEKDLLNCKRAKIQNMLFGNQPYLRNLYCSASSYKKQETFQQSILKLDLRLGSIRKKDSYTSLVSKFPNGPIKLLKGLHCNHCQELFHETIDFANHLDYYGLYTYPFCPDPNCLFSRLGFLKKIDLKIHISNYHLSLYNSCKNSLEKITYKNNNFHPKIFDELINNLYVCNHSQCGRIFYRRDSLTRHIRALHKE